MARRTNDASSILNVPVDNTDIGNGKVLAYNSVSGHLEYETVAGVGDTEGTSILSTGETGGTKFLREDGDGTSSWQAVPAPEGTAVKSTGEAGGTKFLREDGDGTSSWQTLPVTSFTGGTLTSGLVLATGTTVLAPLTMVAGTNLTVPVAGTFEFDGTNLYFSV